MSLMPFAPAAAASGLSPVTIVLAPSPDVTGAASAAAINAAVAALPAAGGVIALAPTGPWHIKCGQVVINGSGIYISAQGCFISAVGSGDMIDMHDTSLFSARTVHGGGILGQPIIDGTLTTGSSSAVHMGDIFNATCDVQAYNFTAGTTSKGVWFDNRYWYTEALHARIFANNCAAHVVLDVNSGQAATGAHVNATGSFERANLDIQFNQGAATQDGVVLQNGAFILDGTQLAIHGNCVTSATALTSAAVRLNGSTPAGITDASASIIQTTPLAWGVECDGAGANAPMTVNFGTVGNFTFDCTGLLDFAAATPFTSSNSSGQWVGFVGIVAGDPNLPAFLPAAGTNVADSAQVITAVVGAPATVTNVSVTVAAFTAYRVRVYVPYSSSAVAGTPTFLFNGPGFAIANITWRYQTAVTPFTTAPAIATAAPTMTGPTLSAGTNLALIVDGTIVFGAAGEAGLSAYTSSAADPFTIETGAYFEILPMSAP